MPAYAPMAPYYYYVSSGIICHSLLYYARIHKILGRHCLLSAGASDTDVQVACLTCYGAVVSTSPALPEVQGWLGEREGGPWLVEHCTTLLKGGGEQMNCGLGLW